MALIAFPARHLQLQQPLPFRVYDGKGLLIMAAGTVIENDERLQALRRKPMLVDEQEAGLWLRNADETAQSLVMRDAQLQDIAVARMRQGGGVGRGPLVERAAAPRQEASVVERWESAMRRLGTVLREAQPTPDWLSQFELIATQTWMLVEERPAEVLFLLMQHAAHSTLSYSAHHAALCAHVCVQVAATLDWSVQDRQTLMQAALSMNIGMSQLQDELARQKEPLSPAQRQAVEGHALRSTSMLVEAGVKDPRWLKAVRLHHDTALDKAELDQLDTASRLARLLSLVDRFTAKISRRATREPMSPLAAAKLACQGPDGRPDALGAALLRTLGMYPPGSYVQLANGEIGVVMARGAGKATMPLVAVLIGSSGMPLEEPVLRDTAYGQRNVTGALRVSELRVRLNHEKLIDLL